MQISVIVATYKRQQFLTRCLSSLVKQKRLPDEIVLVVRPDDEESIEVISDFKAKYDLIDFKIGFVERPGVVFAENVGLDLSRGEIACFIDDDAIAKPDWLSRIEDGYRSDPFVGALGGPVIPVVAGVPIIETTPDMMRITWYGKRIGNSTMIPTRALEVDVLRGCNMSFRRKLIDRFDERLRGYWGFEDEACLRISKKGYKVLCDPNVVVYHYLAPITAEYSRGGDKLALISANHNNTYISLKHFQPARKFVFILYTFLIGDSHYPGALRYLIAFLRGSGMKRIFRELTWSTVGRFLGLFTYMRTLRKGV